MQPYVERVVDKITFGSVDLPKIIKDYGESVDEIELCGLVSNICVLSNVVMVKAALPNAVIIV